MDTQSRNRSLSDLQGDDVQPKTDRPGSWTPGTAAQTRPTIDPTRTNDLTNVAGHRTVHPSPGLHHHIQPSFASVGPLSSAAASYHLPQSTVASSGQNWEAYAARRGGESVGARFPSDFSVGSLQQLNDTFSNASRPLLGDELSRCVVEYSTAFFQKAVGLESLIETVLDEHRLIIRECLDLRRKVSDQGLIIADQGTKIEQQAAQLAALQAKLSEVLASAKQRQGTNFSGETRPGSSSPGTLGTNPEQSWGQSNVSGHSGRERSPGDFLLSASYPRP